MIRAFVYALVCLLSLVIQTGLIASLPEPFRLLFLPLVVGIIILHERSLVLGSLWIGLFGFILELRGLGSGYALAGLTSAVAGLSLAISVFAKRSLWALMGLAAATTAVFVLARVIWLLATGIIVDNAVSLGVIGRSLEQGLITVLLSVMSAFIFGVYLRRLAYWFRSRFVTAARSEYEISLPPT